MRRWVVLLLFVVALAGCGASRRVVVRLDTGHGEPSVQVSRGSVAPVEVSREDFRRSVAQYARAVPATAHPLEDAARRFGVPERSGWFRYDGRTQRLLALESGGYQDLRSSPEDEALKRHYLLWCARTWTGGDCLRVLGEKPFLEGDAKYALAMAIAHSQVLAAMKGELARQVSPEAVVATVVGGLTLYAVLLALPEPVTKGVAALLTVGLVAYLGWDTVWRLIDGWLVLMREVEGATTFEAIAASGEKFGHTLGEKAARAFVMLALVAMGNTAAGMAATLPTLPGAGQAALVAGAELNLSFSALTLARVESVALGVEGVTLALAHDPSGATEAPPPSAGGPGEWVRVNESMSESARRYQAEQTGAPNGYSYRVKRGDQEVDFDGYRDGVLIEVKGRGYAQWITEELEFLKVFQGRHSLFSQARRQLEAAPGAPIRWVVAEERLAGALRRMFNIANFEIDVVCVPPTP